MIIFALLYLHNRFATKYRDLGIIALLFLLLFAGTQYEKYVLTNGMIVRIDSKNIDYQLNLNDDRNTYTLTQAHVIDHKVEVIK